LDKLFINIGRVRHPICCWLAKQMARRERGAYPLRYVTSEQRSQRLCEPQPDGAWRKMASASLPLPAAPLGIARPASPPLCPFPLTPKCKVILARALSLAFHILKWCFKM